MGHLYHGELLNSQRVGGRGLDELQMSKNATQQRRRGHLHHAVAGA